MSAPGSPNITRRVSGGNVWLGRARRDADYLLANLPSHRINYEVLETEEAVGRAMLEELEQAARDKAGDLAITLLGGRGAQAMHRMLGEQARTSEKDDLLGRLHVFTQDGLAPLRMDNGFSFVRDFERLLGDDFFRKVKSFTPMRSDTDDLEAEMTRYIEKLESMGGLDIFFIGLGPEAGAASHLAYIKPGSGATINDLAGVIPISSSILDHHIAKFKAGGSPASETDEQECRAATHILTLGPAAILGAKKIVQSIVDASSAPAKRESFRRVLEEELSSDARKRAEQLDNNPGLLVRLHPNVRSLVLPDLL